jgi:hypothetical protein
MTSVFGRSLGRFSSNLLLLAVSFGLTVGVRAAVNGDAEVSDAGTSAASAAVINAAGSGGARTVVTGDGVGSGVSLNNPTLVTVAPNGTVYYYDTTASGTALGVFSINPATGARALVSGDGVGTGPAFVAVSGLAWDLATSSLVVSDSGSSANNSGILGVDPSSGNRTQITGNGLGSGAAIDNPQFATVAANGTIYYYETTASGTADGVVAVNPANGARTLVSGGSGPLGSGSAFVAVTGLAWDLSTSTLIASDAGTSSSNSGIIRVDPSTGDRTFVTGNGAGSGVALDVPEFATVTLGGTIYYFEEGASGTANSVISVNPTGGARSILSGDGVGSGTAFIAPTWVAAANLAPVISDASLAASGTVGVGFVTYTISAIDSPVSFSAIGLPSGLLLNPANGQITGIPSQAGVFDVTIGATNAAGTGTATLVITISSVTLTVSPGSLPGTSIGAAYSQTITASGGTPPYSFLVTSGTPVPGLLLSSGGVLSGGPTTAGTFTFTVTATDSSTGVGAPFTGSQAYTVVVAQASQTINFTTIGTVMQGLPYTLSATASSGLPVTLTVLSGDATITGTSLKILNLLPVTIVASQGGNATYSAAASVTQTVTAIPANTRSTAKVATPGSGSAAALGAPEASGATLLAVSPASLTVGAGASPTLSVSASGTVQWLFNGAAIGGATGPTLTLASIGTNQAGTYTAVVTNPDGSIGTGAAIVGVTADARLIDASTRAHVGATDDQSLLTGFAVAGIGPEPLLIRGIGPSLDLFQVAGPLASPQLSLYDVSGSLIAANSGWSSPLATGPSPIAASVQPASSALFAQLNVFGLPVGSPDCALLADLPAGVYTAKLSGLNQATGVAMAELTDAGSGAPTSHLTNLSARAQVGSGSSVLVAGFVVSGTTSETLLIRGVGPALGSFGVTGTLAAPQLTLYDSSGNVIATNVGWSNASLQGNSSVAAGVQAATAAVIASVDAFALPAGSADSAFVATLPPGAYTAQVSGVNGTTGTGLIEVYDVPSSAP